MAKLGKEEIQKLIETHRRRLYLRKQQYAAQGLSVDPGIIIEIEDIEKEIEELEVELKAIKELVEVTTRADVPPFSEKDTEKACSNLAKILNISNNQIICTSSQGSILVQISEEALDKLIVLGKQNIPSLRWLGIQAIKKLDNLSSVLLDGVNLRGFNFFGTDLSNTNLNKADLRNVRLVRANLKNAQLKKAKMSNADLRNANLNEANLDMADLQGANLKKADMFKVNLCNTNLNKTLLTGAYLIKANLTKATMTNVNLHRAYLMEANLEGVNLRGATLTNCDLSEANLKNADLRGANLSGAKLRGANLEGANLTGANLNNVTYDSTTVWPPNYNQKRRERKIRVDKHSKSIWVGDRREPLTDQEFELIFALDKKRCGVVEYSELERLLPHETISEVLASLRKKIEPSPSEPIYIVNVRSYGYTLIDPSDETNE